MDSLKRPNFRLQRVYSDGSMDEPGLYELKDIDWDWNMGRRGFLITSALGIGALSGYAIGQEAPTVTWQEAPVTTGECADEINAHIDWVFTVSFSPDGKLLASGSADKTIKLWKMPSGKFLTCLFDPAVLEKGKEVNQYTSINEFGQTITYTLPCGSPIPPGAICTCNCIPGTYYVAPPSRSGGTYCSCDMICTCIPIK